MISKVGFLLKEFAVETKQRNLKENMYKLDGNS